VLASTEKRKLSHIHIGIKEDVQARRITTGFEDVFFVHRAMPSVSLQEVEVSADFFGHRLSAPILIESITGGTKRALRINAALAEAAETFGLAMGVGSQRAAVEDPSLEYTFRVVRERAPNAFLIANLGAPQLTRGYGVQEAEKAVEMIGADALFIHTNSLQEAIQPEGETDYRGVIPKIKEIVEGVRVPVIVKETGAGIAAEDAEKMEAVGVKGVDVGGAGGTSWAAVEHFRAKQAKNRLRETLGETFWDWGIPTAASVVEVHQSTKLKVIAAGGVRSGLDVAKSIALGADVAGLALPLLKPALKGAKQVKKTLQTAIEGFKTAMFLTGCRKLEDLKRSQIVITGKTAEWLEARGFKPEEYARRRY